MANIVQFPQRPAPQRLPQVNLAVVALVNGRVMAAPDLDHMDDLTDAQLSQAVEETAALVERLMELVEQRSIRARVEK